MLLRLVPWVGRLQTCQPSMRGARGLAIPPQSRFFSQTILVNFAKEARRNPSRIPDSTDSAREGSARNDGGKERKGAAPMKKKLAEDEEPDTAYDPSRVFQAPWKKKFSFRRRDEHWYSEKMNKFIQYNRLKDAVALLDEMRFHYIKPNVPVYNTLLGGYSRLGDYKGAMKLYNQLKKVGLHPNERTFNLLFTALGNTQFEGETTSEKIKDLVAEMQKAGVAPNLYIQNSLMKAFARAGDLKEVVKQFERLKYLDIRPDKASYSVVINAFASTGSVQDAYTFLKEAESKNIPVDTYLYNSFLVVCLNSPSQTDTRLAFPIYEQMKQNNDITPNAVTLTMMVNIARKLGKMELKGVLQEALEALQRKDFGLDIAFANTMLGSFDEDDDEKLFEDVFKKLKGLDMVNVTSFNIYIRFYAWKLKAAVSKLLKKDKYPTRSRLKSIRSQFVTKAQEGYDELRAKEYLPNEDTVRYLALVAKYSADYKRALFAIELIDTFHLKPTVETLRLLVHCIRTKGSCQEVSDSLKKRIREMEGAGEPEEDASDKEGNENLQDGVYVDPEEKFDFTRVEPRKSQSK